MRSIGVASVVLLLAAPFPAVAKRINVNPGDSIQAAVDAANPGDMIVVQPGVYEEAGQPCPDDPGDTCAVVVSKDNIRLRGLYRKGPVVLQNPGGQARGISVVKPGASGATCLTDASQRVRRFDVRGFTVNGFDDDGIFLFCVERFRITGNETHDNVEYGIFPSHCLKGRVSHNVATGSNDTGIYIGQSDGIRIDRNLAMGNVSGFEIENSSNVRCDHNESTGNTGGILSFTLPNLDVKANDNNKIDLNWVHDNNKVNTCVDPGDAVCAVPQGTGILVLAADHNLVYQNEVTGNDSFGIAVGNYCVANNLTMMECAALDIDPDPDFNTIAKNTVTGNGSNPDPMLPPVFAVDLAWDTTGTGNCWSLNVFGTSFPSVLPACP
jgi:parallel beta-helix repeat protein